MAKKKKRFITKAESAELFPIVSELNSLAKDFLGTFKARVEKKEAKISVLVSQIKAPKKGSSRIDVTNVDISKDFIKSMRKRKRGQGSSEFDEYFSQKKGSVN